MSSVTINFKKGNKLWCYIKLLNVVIFVSFNGTFLCLRREQCCSVIKVNHRVSYAVAQYHVSANKIQIFFITSFQLSAFQFVDIQFLMLLQRCYTVLSGKSLENVMMTSSAWPVKPS